MLRSATVACTFTTLRRQFFSSTKISAISILIPHPNLSTQRSRQTEKPLLPTAVFAHPYARMARRIPPVRPAIEDSDSESEPDIEDEKCEVGVDGDDDDDDDDDDGESEEWEGFMLDFGELEKLKNQDERKKDFQKPQHIDETQ